MSENLSSAAVVIGDLRVNTFWDISYKAEKIRFIKYGLSFILA